MAQDNLEEGANYFEKAIESSPEEEIIRLDYGDAMVEKNEWTAAENIMLETIEKFPESAIACFRMAAYLYLQGKNKEASYFFEEAMMMDFEKHASVFEQFPELKDNAEIISLIHFYGQ